MIHIPGVYSGGETAGGHKWTQTKGGVELRVRLPEGTADGAVRCEIEPRTLRLTSGDLNLSGELDAVVVVADSLWSVETDGPAKTAVVSLRKAIAGLWTRLLVTDAPAADAPRLLDGPERAAPRSKAELLADAKGRAKASLDGPSKAKTHAIEGRIGETLTVSPADLPELPVLVLRNCRECHVEIPAGLSAVKVQVEGCSQLELVIDGKVLTETLELYKCDRYVHIGHGACDLGHILGISRAYLGRCTVELRSKLATVQLDSCTDLTLRYASCRVGTTFASPAEQYMEHVSRQPLNAEPVRLCSATGRSLARSRPPPDERVVMSPPDEWVHHPMKGVISQ